MWKDKVKSLSGQRILILGDVGVDEYVNGAVKRISPEAPVPIVEVNHEDQCLGLSGNVAQNIKSLGAEPILFSVVGEDSQAKTVVSLLEKQGITGQGMVTDSSRPTTRKLRVMADQHHIVRVDFEERKFISNEVESRMLQEIEKVIPSVDSVILQDYAKGVMSENLIQSVIELSHRHSKKVFVDPHRTTPLEFYRGSDVFKPNLDEAVILTGFQRDSLAAKEDFLDDLGSNIMQRLESDHVILTRGGDGMSLFSRAGHRKDIPTAAQQVFDVTGAGDTVIAALALGDSAGLSLLESCKIANIAAGIVVSKVGCVACSQEELLEEISQLT